MSTRRETVRELRRTRPVDRFARRSVALIALLVAATWLFGVLDLPALARDAFVDDFATLREESARAHANVTRFLGEVRPYPLHGRPWDTAVAARWATDLFVEGIPRFDIPSGFEAAWRTLAISITAIVMAGLAATLCAFPAARTFATPEPFLPGSDRISALQRRAWRAALLVARGLLVFLRSVPEYVWAYLLIGMLGISAWPAVVALAIHNAGILGKLDAETVENLAPQPLAALRGAGATRRQVAFVGALPAALSRFLLYFFYRWETCVREATVLGMLGIVSLGYALSETRIRQRYDDMLFYILLGTVLVLVGDLVSLVARGLVRRAS